ncbi:MAG: succinylglutamate desuccinylase/aspartoacylase family protein, partial [Nitrospinae bacterium]|nr:succinylglutamate desuccinylase/aspartoacylase family protein [Nitrospinota bacterium]
MASTLKIGEVSIKKGERKTIQLAVSHLYDGTDLSIPVEVIRGKDDGPTLFVSAAIHGDEINGIEIIGRILKSKLLKKMKGTLLAVPVVNVFGFNMLSRYLPDRRDLNRSFPGSKKGSLASRLANVFMKEIVKNSTHGIDLHTGSIHRTNLPQIRACMNDSETKRLAFDFGVPVILNSSTRDGSLREAARRKKIPMLLFEGGEALRFDEKVINIGVQGCFSVMQSIGMLTKRKKTARKEVFVSWASQWLRSPASGLFRTSKDVGAHVGEGEVLGYIKNQFGKTLCEVTS